MDEELLNIIVEEHDTSIVDAEELIQESAITESGIDMEVGTLENTVIKMDNNSVVPSGLLVYENNTHKHPLSTIENLLPTLEKLALQQQTYAVNGGFAEFREWHPNSNLKGKNNTHGYFVQLTKENNNSGNLYIDTANDNTGVYGVTVSTSGFCGYQSINYDMLGIKGENPTLGAFNNNQSNLFAQVCLIGCAEVRIVGEIDIGNYVVPSSNGYAVKSDNGVGYRVVSIRTDNTQKYVGIILTPQNESIDYIAKKITEAQNGVGVINGQLGDLAGKVEGIDKIVISIGDKFNALEGEDGVIQGVKKELQSAVDARKAAEEIAKEAKEKMSTMQLQYDSAKQDMSDAKASVEQVTKDLAELQKDMTHLASWEGSNGEQGVAAFVAQANKDSTALASMTKAFGPNGEDITAIIQKIDSNGGAIEMMVSHIDKYILGKYSPTVGFTQAETNILKPGHIYVPTETHTERSPLYHNKSIISLIKDQIYYFKITIKKEDKAEEVQYYTFSAPKSSRAMENIKFNTVINELSVDDIICTHTECSEVPNNVIELKEEYEYNFQYLDTTNGKPWKSYEWKHSNDSDIYEWAPYQDVLTIDHGIPKGTENNSLWYCIEDVLNGDKVQYSQGILYYWNGEQWIIAAKVNDDTYSNTIGVIRQTASKLSSTYTNVAGDISNIKQTANEIATSVQNIEGDLSQIEQTAKNIRMGVYNPEEGSTSLEILLGGLTSTAINAEPKLVQSLGGSTTVMGGKYEKPPTWNGTEFVFSGEAGLSDTHKYYFESRIVDGIENGVKTYYCEDIDGGYRIWAMDSIAIASLNTRVTDTESEVKSWTQFKSELNETMTSITQNSSDTEASIFSNVFGEYNKRTDIIYVGEDKFESRVNDVDWYSKPPKWNNAEEKFEFVEGAINKNQIPKDVYCILETTPEYYYKLLFDQDKTIIGYELYKHIDSNYASILQKSEPGSASLELVVGSTGKDASGLLIGSINGNTEAQIKADKIGINGTAIFRDNMRDGTTTISGNYIKTGVLVSENYDGPATYVQYGLKIENNKIVVGEDTDCIRHSPITKDVQYELLPIGGYYYADKIEVGAELTEFESDGNVYIADHTCYVVGINDFDLTPQNGSENHITLGAKFDLNVGTIYSKNFSLDREGDLTIAGRISATSGYIGDGTNGFTIDAHGSTRTIVVGEEMEAGSYYLKHNNKYYVFTTEEVLSEGATITLYCDSTQNDENGQPLFNININGISTSITAQNQYPTDAKYLMSELTTGIYYLANKQWTLEGDKTDNPGVYISPEGIGLGNGKFSVDKNGITKIISTFDSEGNPSTYSIYDGNGYRRYIDGERIQTYSMLWAGAPTVTSEKGLSNNTNIFYHILFLPGGYYYQWAIKMQNATLEQRAQMFQYTYQNITEYVSAYNHRNPSYSFMGFNIYGCSPDAPFTYSYGAGNEIKYEKFGAVLMAQVNAGMSIQTGENIWSNVQCIPMAQYFIITNMEIDEE